MKYILAVLVFVISMNTAIAQTNTNVVSHNKVTIVTDPSQGFNSLKSGLRFRLKTKRLDELQ